ncbi:MAG: hypothetical protein WC758_01060 [Candidatus Woesearchaeota archaeon]|jgi:hypothetical protein
MSKVIHLGTNKPIDELYSSLENCGFNKYECLHEHAYTLKNPTNNLLLQVHPTTGWFRHATIKYQHHLELVDHTDNEDATLRLQTLETINKELTDLVYDPIYDPILNGILTANLQRELIPIQQYISEFKQKYE